MSRKVGKPTPHLVDMRIGVSEIEHELLDLIDAARGAINTGSSGEQIAAASKDAAAALRADPATGNGQRRRSKALDAAVRLLLAVEAMDAGR